MVPPKQNGDPAPSEPCAYRSAGHYPAELVLCATCIAHGSLRSMFLEACVICSLFFGGKASHTVEGMCGTDGMMRRPRLLC